MSKLIDITFKQSNMSLQEKKALVNIFSSLLIISGYVYYVFVLHGAENIPRINELKFWAQLMVYLVPVSLVCKIIIMIIFNILKAIITRKSGPDVVDELDRLIDLKAMRNGCIIFVIGFFISMLSVTLDYPVSTMFIVLFSFGLTGEIVGELSKIYFYRKGIR